MVEVGRALRDKNLPKLNNINKVIPSENFEILKFVFNKESFSFFQVNITIKGKRVTIPERFGITETPDIYLEIVDLMCGSKNYVEHERVNEFWKKVLYTEDVTNRDNYLIDNNLNKLISEARKYMMMETLAK